MMQPCASAAKLRGGGPILRRGLEDQTQTRQSAQRRDMQPYDGV